MTALGHFDICDTIPTHLISISVVLPLNILFIENRSADLSQTILALFTRSSLLESCHPILRIQHRFFQTKSVNGFL